MISINHYNEDEGNANVNTIFDVIKSELGINGCIQTLADKYFVRISKGNIMKWQVNSITVVGSAVREFST